MAKTIGRENNSAARANAAVRQPQDVEEGGPVNAAQPGDETDELAVGDDSDDTDDMLATDETDYADEADEDADGEARAVAPVDDERVVTRTSAAGAQVPAFLLTNPFTRIFAESYLELRKVTWPSRRDAWNMTIIVIVVSAIMAALLALADYGLGHLLTYLVNIGLGK